MRPLLSPEEMGRADAAAIESGTPGEVLMERAGGAVLRAVIELAGGRYGGRIAVVCGKGNNGGDGFVVARRARREGMSVRCLFVGDPAGVKGAAANHLNLMKAAGVVLEPFDSRALSAADVIVDAIFGTGFRGVAEGSASDAIAAVNSSGAPVAAVDIPSGIDGATGRAGGPAVRAAVTVTMAAEKIGTAIGAGALHAGRVDVAEIGIPIDGAEAWMTEAADVAQRLPSRAADAHKRSLGAVALLGGSAGMSGAVVLAANAAVRAGAGYVTAGVTSAIDAVVSVAVPEVLTQVVTDHDVLGPDALDAFGPVVERAGVLAVGPGLGRGEPQAALVGRVLDEIGLPVVLDADALNVLAGDTGALQKRAAPSVLTPHPAELARLLDVSVADIQDDRLRSVRRAAERFGCIVLLKGFRTLVAEPGGKVVVNPTGGPELATAGTGDVLTGAIATLLAAGLDAFEGAWMGAYLHGLAGGVAAEHGVRGVSAGDVAQALPEAAAGLTSTRSFLPGASVRRIEKKRTNYASGHGAQ
jgi:NAD(P)H-hydrate epimerase